MMHQTVAGGIDLYAIYITQVAGVNRVSGWFKKSKLVCDDHTSLLEGERAYIPVVVSDVSKSKAWGTLKGAMSYADTLVKRLETRQWLNNVASDCRYRHRMDYIIQVIDLQTKSVVHKIMNYSFSSAY